MMLWPWGASKFAPSARSSRTGTSSRAGALAVSGTRPAILLSSSCAAWETGSRNSVAPGAASAGALANGLYTGQSGGPRATETGRQMDEITTAWRYTAAVDPARRRTLAAPGRFINLVSLVATDIRDVHVRVRDGKDPGLKDCMQPIFTFHLPSTGDALFNGPFGLRAQYFLDPWNGLAANGVVISKLAPSLVQSVHGDESTDLSSLDVFKSLHAASAKLWIIEDGTQFADTPIGLAVKRWSEAAQNGNELAQFGILAPVPRRFEVKGALLDSHGHEVVPKTKVGRHFEIHSYGYS